MRNQLERATNMYRISLLAGLAVAVALGVMTPVGAAGAHKIGLGVGALEHRHPSLGRLDDPLQHDFSRGHARNAGWALPGIRARDLRAAAYQADKGIAAAFRTAAIEEGVQIVWGGVWDRLLNDITGDLNTEAAAYGHRWRKANPNRVGGPLFDGPHFELSRKAFPAGVTSTPPLPGGGA